jgi:cytoskeletal protein CcmA (bactofilin family)
MFLSRSKSATDEPMLGSNSIIGAGTIITGNIESVGDIRIDGTLKGNLTCKAKLLIGPQGIIEGDVTGQQANILGLVHGKIRMTGLLHLQGKAVVEGDIHAAKLQIETTVKFNGKCHMGANVVELGHKNSGELATAVNE